MQTDLSLAFHLPIILVPLRLPALQPRSLLVSNAAMMDNAPQSAATAPPASSPPAASPAAPSSAAPAAAASALSSQLSRAPRKGRDIEEDAMRKQILLTEAYPGGRSIPHRWTGALLESAYQRCGEVTSEYAKTFYLGTQLMTPEKARAIWAIYVW